MRLQFMALAILALGFALGVVFHENDRNRAEMMNLLFKKISEEKNSGN